MNGMAAAAISASILQVGNIYFGRFEQETARWRRLMKLAILVGGSFLLERFAGALWSLAWIFALAIVGLTVHFWWTRKHGIDPFTAEPYEKYRQLRGWS